MYMVGSKRERSREREREREEIVRYRDKGYK